MLLAATRRAARALRCAGAAAGGGPPDACAYASLRRAAGPEAQQALARAMVTVPRRGEGPSPGGGGGSVRAGVLAESPPQVRADEGGGGGKKKYSISSATVSGGGQPRALSSVAALKEEIDGVVIGQDDAKTRLCIQVYKHYKRLQSREAAEQAKAGASPDGYQHDIKPMGGVPPFDVLPGKENPHAPTTKYHETSWEVPPKGMAIGGKNYKAWDAALGEGAAAGAQAGAHGAGAALAAAFGAGEADDDLNRHEDHDEDLADVVLEKANILICGPTGSGKTHLIRALGKIVDVPVVTQDATGLTAAGYVGEDVDNCLLRLLDAADGDVKKAERGIVYIDEIDKLARYADNQRDVGGEGVQQALLKMVEGDLVTVNKDKNSRDRRSEATIDTSSILFIVGGAFVGLDKLVARRTKKASAGIGAPLVARRKADTVEGMLEQGKRAAMDVTPADLTQFGLIPEFVGRFPVVAALQPLAVEDLARILVEPRQALVKQYRKEFRECETRFAVTPGACRAVAERAFRDNVGARGLRTIMEGLLHHAQAQLPVPKGVDGVLLDAAAVREYYDADPLERGGLGAKLIWGDAGELERRVAEAVAAEESNAAGDEADGDADGRSSDAAADGIDQPKKLRATA